MDIQRTATQLLDVAEAEQQAVMRVESTDSAQELRSEIRRQARQRRLRIRTGLIDDVVAVVLAEADIWHMSAETMRRKLTPPPSTSIEG